jgi:shikimate kinase
MFPKCSRPGPISNWSKKSEMRSIILIGMKSSGKTTVGKALAAKLGIACIDLDAQIEQTYHTIHHKALSFRNIFRQHGSDYFRHLEASTLERLHHSAAHEHFVLAVGGGTPLAEQNRQLLRALGTVVFLDTNQHVLLARITANGVPAFFPDPANPAQSLADLLSVRGPIYAQMADVHITCADEQPDTLADTISAALAALKEGTHAHH